MFVTCATRNAAFQKKGGIVTSEAKNLRSVVVLQNVELFADTLFVVASLRVWSPKEGRSVGLNELCYVLPPSAGGGVKVESSPQHDCSCCWPAMAVWFDLMRILKFLQPFTATFSKITVGFEACWSAIVLRSPTDQKIDHCVHDGSVRPLLHECGWQRVAHAITPSVEL
jgi:hypothetical protein